MFSDEEEGDLALLMIARRMAEKLGEAAGSKLAAAKTCRPDDSTLRRSGIPRG
jgi:hypothetical protein